MKKFSRYIILIAVMAATALSVVAQDRSSSSSVVRRRDANDRKSGKNASGQVTQRMQSHFEETPVSDADMEWMRVIYRQLDLTKDANAPLYFPDEAIDGQENLFRIIMRLLANDQIAAYEYLDGREIFTDQYKIKVKDMLDRFHVIYTDAKGSTERHPKFAIDDSDVPANEVLSYYIVQRYEFDRRTNKMRSRIEAICPVLHRAGDFGGEPMKYPMFWLKFDDLRPFLTTQTVFLSDDNNHPTCTYDDYFQLGLFDGDIYKTRNLRNQSLMQQFPDPDDLKRAQDSIQRRIDSFENNLWVPSLEEIAQAREAREKAEAERAAKEAGEDVGEATGEVTADEDKDDKPVRTTRSARGSKKKADAKEKKPKTPKVKRAKAPKAKGSSNATRSVRNRRR